MRRALLLLVLSWLLPAQADRPVVIASKTFTESVVLGDLAALALRHAGIATEHKAQLGGTRIAWNALLAGEIDVYPEYTGTLIKEILASEKIDGAEALSATLAARGLEMSRPLGFDNSYAMGMRRETAERLGITRISDLRRHPELRFGFSNEFLDRGDGWPALRRRYRLPQESVRGLEHDLAYRGLEADDLDLIDLYATDAEIVYYGLAVLRDDLGHFPSYQAVWLRRRDLGTRHPAGVAALDRLTGCISAGEMQRMNQRAKLEKTPSLQVAADFLSGEIGEPVEVEIEGLAARLLDRLLEHLLLTFAALMVTVALGVPLGIVAASRPRSEPALLGVVGILQTIPSLALLVFMIPALGIGAGPAIAAAVLYGLLPVVRNTHAGLQGVPRSLRESAIVLGLDARQRLLEIEFPLALPVVLAGIKTAAVIAVGTATLGALTGAGGFGQPILTGIRLDDYGLILEGAVPAALLGLGMQALFAGIERRVVPAPLRRGAR